jgi:acetolactate synthase-1/2/3 large subunit
VGEPGTKELLTLAELEASSGAVVVDVRVTREENTYPMIAPGAAARDMVG